ncbi:hypothetical protein [Paenibacillus sp. TY11]|uniref:hypothetical protein n=1 Tax=Paenibacillus sp. TY11 TaxID=3448633 RepID=UPI00403A149F
MKADPKDIFLVWEQRIQRSPAQSLDIMIHRDLLPALKADAWANISDLLHASLQLVMLKKDKRRIEAVLKQLSDLELC